MQPVDFLSRLDLTEEASERDVKRAYARELKLIDPHSDPAAFQMLREAYEDALDWLRSGASDSAPLREFDGEVSHEEVAEPDSSRIPEAQTAHDLSTEMLSELLGFLSSQPRTGEDLEIRLTSAMHDPRMAAVDAREHLEELIARHLAGGWQRGNEILFSVASDYFDWQTDRRRLLRFGHDGVTVDQAIHDLIAFDALPPSLREAYMGLVRDLRSDSAPSGNLLLGSGQLLGPLMSQFPALSSMITNTRNVDRWMRAYRDVQRASQERIYPQPLRKKPGRARLFLRKIGHQLSRLKRMAAISILLLCTLVWAWGVYDMFFKRH